MGLASLWAFVGPKYQNAPADVMPEHPVSITLPAPNGLPPNSDQLSKGS
jgi:succinate dehydrogenase / fumarate reductase cytochrome b subunit